MQMKRVPNKGTLAREIYDQKVKNDPLHGTKFGGIDEAIESVKGSLPYKMRYGSGHDMSKLGAGKPYGSR